MTTRFVRTLALIAAVFLSGSFGRIAQGSLQSSIIGDGRLHGLQDTDADSGARFNVATMKWELVTGTLAVGDILVAGVGFDTLEPLLAPDAPLSGVNAFSMLKIRTMAAAGFSTAPAGVPLSSFVFDAPSVAEWGAIVDDLFGGAAALKKSSEGTLVMLFDQATQDFDRTTPPATLAGSAATIFTGGIEYAELGFTGPVVGGNVQDNVTGEGWTATAPDSPGLASLFPLNTGIVPTSFTVGITRLEGFAPFTLLPLLSPFDAGTAEFTGGGTLSGYGDGSGAPVGPWQIASDADFSFRPYVPEPTSAMCWLGLAVAAGSAGAIKARRTGSRFAD